MGQKKVKKGTNKKSESVTVKVTFDRAIWDIISNTPELGKSDSGKVSNICVSWLSDHSILSGTIKKRLDIK